MGNPTKKENLGNYMTGGHGAMPFFNAFMNPFMKGKPIEKFPETPSIPQDIQALIARNKREELEKLQDAEIAAKKSGATVDASAQPAPGSPLVVGGDNPGAGNPGTVDIKPAGEKPSSDNPPVIKPNAAPPSIKKPETPPGEKQEGTKRKGKKGDG
jgi:hypothetical protein